VLNFLKVNFGAFLARRHLFNLRDQVAQFTIGLKQALHGIQRIKVDPVILYCIS